MPETAQATPPQTNAPEPAAKPLPSTERDLHTRPSRTNTAGFRIGLAVGAIVLLIVGLFVYRYVTSYESTDDAQVDGHINSVSTRITGHVTKLNVDDNQYVQAGTVLVEIDPSDYQVAYEHAKADYQNPVAPAAAAGVNVPITSVNTTSQESASEADVASSRAGISAAKQQFESAK